ncbi:MAG: protein phosphatase 2C domain-containing protein [Clostridiales Family XIII bacterium]|jgi:serine/threonine protein phosphatase PrpC|nr:protein phosphatase 2C domain-containing protein [Clostridiales Family XIII bacterium]
MTENWPYIFALSSALVVLLLLVFRERAAKEVTFVDIGGAQTKGRRETQADAFAVSMSKSGYMMVIADGMGAETLGVKLSKIACQAIEEQYSYYGNNMNTALFFKSAMAFANKRVCNYLGGERGGVSLVVALMIGKRLHFAYAGNTMLAVLRNGELIPLFKGHTMREFAEKSYAEGKLERDDALARLYDKRVYRYIGHEEFDFEGEGAPVSLKAGDVAILMTDGVFSCLGMRNTGELLSGRGDGRTLAGKVIAACERAFCDDNASVIVAKI